MDDWVDDTPIYTRLLAERESTPIYDQLIAKQKEKNEMEKLQKMVNEFREAMDLPVADRPRVLPQASAEMHVKMIRDEFEKELVPALYKGDIVETYDAIIDVMYYLFGLASDSGMDVEPGFREVHNSNMSKMDPETGKAIKAGPDDPSGEPEGKVLKGANYFPPNLGMEIAIQLDFGPEDDTVYRTTKTPITLGVGGKKIGEGEVVMDNNGNMMMHGALFDVEDLPVLGGIGLIDAISSEFVGRAADLSIREDADQLPLSEFWEDSNDVVHKPENWVEEN